MNKLHMHWTLENDKNTVEIDFAVPAHGDTCYYCGKCLHCELQEPCTGYTHSWITTTDNRSEAWKRLPGYLAYFIRQNGNTITIPRMFKEQLESFRGWTAQGFVVVDGWDDDTITFKAVL